MVNLNAVNALLSVRNGVWATVLVCIVLAIRVGHFLPGIMERFNERKRDRAAIEGEQYERMDARLQHVEHEHEECRRQLHDTLRRLAELEGFMMGQGKARQDASRIVAVERLTDAQARKDKRDEEGGAS